jgi:hypothetical protein
MGVMLIDAWQDRLQYPDLRPKVIEEYKVSYGADPEEESRGNFTGGKKVDLVLIEDKAAGISLIQDLQRAHLPVRRTTPARQTRSSGCRLWQTSLLTGGYGYLRAQCARDTSGTGRRAL